MENYKFKFKKIRCSINQLLSCLQPTTLYIRMFFTRKPHRIQLMVVQLILTVV